MGLTKQYLRYVEANIFGIVSGNRANIQYIHYEGSKYVACGSCEYVFIWNVKKNELKAKLNSEANKSHVTFVIQNPKVCSQLAVGYADGAIRIYDLNSQDCVITFNGHKTAITCLNYDLHGIRLVSGSQDTDLVMWDLVNESGLFRMRGHKAQITQALFMSNANILITSSKDKLVKFWDLDVRHCFKTLVLHGNEVLDLALTDNSQRLIITGSSNQIQVFDIGLKAVFDVDDVDLTKDIKKLKLNDNDDDDIDGNDNDDDKLIECKPLGSLELESANKATCLRLKRNVCVTYSTSDKHLQVFKINTAYEIKKRLSKKIKKKRKTMLKTDGSEMQDNDEIEIEQTLNDEILSVGLVRFRHKVKSVGLLFDGNGDDAKCQLAVLLANNHIEFYSVSMSGANTCEPELVGSLANQTHSSDVRTLAFSADSSAFLSASGDSLKLWNRLSLTCIRTLKCDYALSSLFLPDSNHCMIGCKTGKIQLFDINAARMLDDNQAHDDDKSVWSLCLKPDSKGFVSGSADHTVKFWSFDLIDDEEMNKTKKRLTFTHNRTLKLDDDVLCLRISPNGRLLACALLDSTVKVFFMDSLKLYLNLYGHKQPVLSMDISFDNKLIVTGSADRHLKIWGLDFGDCHRSLFAHEDSIMNVQFAGNTHYLFTCGKDGKLKEWDCDKFERIITLDGHSSEIWTLCVSGDGKFVITASHDKSMRLWERTHEPLVLEDERENENDAKYEKEEILKEEHIIPGSANNLETGLATIKTIDTIKSAEKLIESLDIYIEEEIKKQEYDIALLNAASADERNKIKPGNSHPLLTALGEISAEQYVLDTLKTTKSRVNYGQITSTHSSLNLIEKLKYLCETKLNRLKDTIGFNLAGMKYLKERIEDDKQVQLFSDATAKFSKQKKKKPSLFSTLKT